MNNLKDNNVLDVYGTTFPLTMTQQVRYNNRNRIHNEDLAQHSFIVAYNILKICFDYKIPNDIAHNAVAMAIVHDMPEMFTADIPHNCKVNYPELQSMLSEIEKTYIHSEIPEVETLFLQYTKIEECVKCELPVLLVHIGDAISVLQYVNREIDHGNNASEMCIIKNEASARIIKLFNILNDKLNQKVKD